MMRANAASLKFLRSTPDTVAPSAAAVGTTASASAPTRACVVISCVVIASSGAGLTNHRSQHSVGRTDSRCRMAAGYYSLFNCLRRGIRRQKAHYENHSAKSALRVIQNANNDRQRAYLTKRSGVVFIVATAHNSAQPTFQR